METFSGPQKPHHTQCIISDLDGTLALIDSRNPYDASRGEADPVHTPIVEILRKFADEVDILIVTGRKATYSSQTLRWLEAHAVPYTKLHMRSSDDNRKDTVIKKEVLENEILPHYDSILFVLEDRNQAVDFWRSEGLTCLQVAPGDF